MDLHRFQHIDNPAAVLDENQSSGFERNEHGELISIDDYLKQFESTLMLLSLLCVDRNLTDDLKECFLEQKYIFLSLLKKSVAEINQDQIIQEREELATQKNTIDEYLQQLKSWLMAIVSSLREDIADNFKKLFEDQQNFFMSLLHTCIMKIKEPERQQPNVADPNEVTRTSLELSHQMSRQCIKFSNEYIIIKETYTSHPRQFLQVCDLIKYMINTKINMRTPIKEITLITRPYEKMIKLSSLLKMVMKDGRTISLDRDILRNIIMIKGDNERFICIDGQNYIVIKNILKRNKTQLPVRQLLEIVIETNPAQNAQGIEIKEEDYFVFKENNREVRVQIGEIDYFVLRQNSDEDANSLQIGKLNYLAKICNESNIQFKCALDPKLRHRVITIKNCSAGIDICFGRGVDMYKKLDPEKTYRDPLLNLPTLITIYDIDLERLPQDIIYLRQKDGIFLQNE